MAQIVKLRRSSVIGKKPTNAQLELGELSINTSDGKVYFAKSGSLGPSIEELVSTNTVNTGSLNITDNITASFFTGTFVGDGSRLTGISAATHFKVTGSNGVTYDFDLYSPITIDGTNGIIVEPYQDSIHLTIGTITGSLNVSGSVTASYFVGDGSQLTNLPAAANVLNISGSDGQNTQVDLLNSFLAITGSGMVTASIANGGIEIYVPYVQGGGGGVSAIYIADQGNLIGTASYFDFNGAGVSTTVNDGTASVYIPGGGGGTGTTLSDGSYVKLDQTTPATTWNFNHNLSQKYPIFQVYDSAGKVLIPKEIIAVDANNATIIFPSYQTGTVIASLGTGPAGLTQYFDPATTWTLNHNMGADYPIVTVWDDNKNIIFPQKIESLSSNTVRVTFSEPVSGHLNVAKGGHIIGGSVGAGNVDFSGTQIVSGSLQIKNLGFATTGSNYFKGDQIISGTLSLKHSKIGDACVTTSDVATVFSLSSFSGAIFDYVVNYGMNMRAGTITAVWNGMNSSFNETATTDLGNTDGISFDVTGTGDLIANVTDYNNWEITAMYRALGCNSGTPTTPTPTPTKTSIPTPTSTPGITPTPTPTFTQTSILDFTVSFNCQPSYGIMNLVAGYASGGIGPYYYAENYFGSEASALANTVWNSFPSIEKTWGHSPANGTYWLAVKDSIGNIAAKSVTTNCAPTPTPTSTPTPTPPTYILIGTASQVGSSSCTAIGTTPSIYLDSTDYSLYMSNGGCFSDGINTVSTIRNSDGTPISGTFYFKWIGSSCSTTTFKSTNGILTINPTQC